MLFRSKDCEKDLYHSFSKLSPSKLVFPLSFGSSRPFSQSYIAAFFIKFSLIFALSPLLLHLPAKQVHRWSGIFYLNFVGKDFVICVERRGIYYHSISFLIHLNDNRKYYNESYIVGRKCLISIL